eukprot:CAMPEP_0119299572 /NCGR_PEP_ID=MMETSP1333-20130426/1642_1 /TAXON_ID=418940 /ORGANISM="Scyphosphaera apsteinii, Strain RCC1455" /LENGTH=446 /DNA_ID=CAMNT_0007301043 /DNA_START=44 /DNA_END=1384 /DNA_ORIENTATION=-
MVCLSTDPDKVAMAPSSPNESAKAVKSVKREVSTEASQATGRVADMAPEMQNILKRGDTNQDDKLSVGEVVNAMETTDRAQKMSREYRHGLLAVCFAALLLICAMVGMSSTTAWPDGDEQASKLNDVGSADMYTEQGGDEQASKLNDVGSVGTADMYTKQIMDGFDDAGFDRAVKCPRKRKGRTKHRGRRLGGTFDPQNAYKLAYLTYGKDWWSQAYSLPEPASWESYMTIPDGWQEIDQCSGHVYSGEDSGKVGDVNAKIWSGHDGLVLTFAFSNDVSELLRRAVERASLAANEVQNIVNFYGPAFLPEGSSVVDCITKKLDKQLKLNYVVGHGLGGSAATNFYTSHQHNPDILDPAAEVITFSEAPPGPTRFFGSGLRGTRYNDPNSEVGLLLNLFNNAIGSDLVDSGGDHHELEVGKVYDDTPPEKNTPTCPASPSTAFEEYT